VQVLQDKKMGLMKDLLVRVLYSISSRFELWLETVSFM
jgi:hypothetical protein